MQNNNSRRYCFAGALLLLLVLFAKSAAFPQDAYSRRAGGPASSSAEEEIQRARQEVRASATNRQNLDKRYKVLQEWVRLLFQRGVDVSSVYPRGTGAEIESLMRNNEVDKAAGLIDTYYRGLESLATGKALTATPEKKAREAGIPDDKAVSSRSMTDRTAMNRLKTDSPFGINGFYVPKMVVQVLKLSGIQEVTQKLEHQTVPKYVELGARWGRIHPAAFGSFSQDNIDRNKDGKSQDFSSQDSYVKLAQKYNISLIPSLSPESNWLQSTRYAPSDIEAYRSYVRRTVERYDGDGVSDMPGLLSPIKYWQLDNEADLRYKVRGDGFESPSEYFRVLKATYEAMKEADPSALLMANVAGLGQGLERSSISYIRELIALGAKDYFDIFSYHVYPETYDPADFQSYFQEVRSLIGNKPIWITETAIAGQSSEQFKEQACWLVKNYVFHLANGVEKILWLDVSDGSPKTRDIVAKNGGLVTFAGTKKPSYYTYRLMTSKLSGFSSVKTIQDGQYKFEFKNRGPVYVMWSDKNKAVDMSSYLTSRDILVTYPIVSEGKEEAEKKILETNTVSLNECPLFVEQR
jgi:hypothetical protein